MSVALIAFDLDGTLLDNNKNIPPENLRALYAAHEAGILLVPATGRILKGMPEDLMKTGLFRYFIFSNGAIIYDLQKERVIHRAEIAPSLAVEVCQYLDGLPVLYDCYRDGFGYITGAMLGRLDEYFRLEPEIRKLVEGGYSPSRPSSGKDTGVLSAGGRSSAAETVSGHSRPLPFACSLQFQLQQH